MSNVINVDFKRKKSVKQADLAWSEYYIALYDHMDKMQLLEEMVRFQEERSAAGRLTPDMIDRGLVLFRLLEETAETEDLRILTRSYRRHLEIEKITQAN